MQYAICIWYMVYMVYGIYGICYRYTHVYVISLYTPYIHSIYYVRTESESIGEDALILMIR